ncbi:unnamed protein product [Kuraishia capsulata CBS 1993]|uniref:Uncharacterized protein n=1 Tax=Kuraishia capsulata CBS 1993 TaxID=1382522 RepID=W6MUP3_9ASCO|nr:uncharacterized protein KUCA_T00001775001 [Kuraishia capsulata CBS 1993]CDK25805.1 unnamed protein product [Kuraishia capsulata CBS 1993]
MNRLTPCRKLSRSIFTSNSEIFKQQKKANLERMVAMLKKEVPNTLKTQLPFDYVDKNVVLRIFPEKLPNVPVIKTNTMYFSVSKILTVIIRNFILSSRVKLHIQQVNVLENSTGLSDAVFDEAESRIMLNKDRVSETESLSIGLFERSTKVVIKWRTCVDGCSHLHTSRTVDSDMGAFRISNLNLYDLFINHSFSEVKKEPDTLHLERVMCGVFVFELSENNDKIKVQTIDDVELVETDTKDKDTDEMKTVKGAY